MWSKNINNLHKKTVLYLSRLLLHVGIFWLRSVSRTSLLEQMQHYIKRSYQYLKNKNNTKYRIISSTNFNAQFNNNMYVTLLSSTCFGLWHAHPQEEQLHKHSIWYPRSSKRLYTTPVESGMQSAQWKIPMTQSEIEPRDLPSYSAVPQPNASPRFLHKLQV